MEAGPFLLDLQRWIKARIRPTPGGSPVDELAAYLNDQRSAPGLERLSVYAGGYLARTRESLAEVYEAVQHVLGERTFTELAHAYAARFPSTEYNLTFRGRRLPEFLEASALTERLPFLPDLARLEWLVCLAFHAVERPPLEAARLSSRSLEAWERARLVLQPSVGLLASAWPVRDIWEARAQPREAIAIDVVNRPQHLVVSRRGFTVTCVLVEPQAYAMLEGLRAQRPLGELCDALAADGVSQEQVGEWCGRWMRLGWLADCEVPCP